MSHAACSMQHASSMQVRYMIHRYSSQCMAVLIASLHVAHQAISSRSSERWHVAGRRAARLLGYCSEANLIWPFAAVRAVEQKEQKAEGLPPGHQALQLPSWPLSDGPMARSKAVAIPGDGEHDLAWPAFGVTARCAAQSSRSRMRVSAAQ